MNKLSDGSLSTRFLYLISYATGQDIVQPTHSVSEIRFSHVLLMNLWIHGHVGTSVENT